MGVAPLVFLVIAHLLCLCFQLTWPSHKGIKVWSCSLLFIVESAWYFGVGQLYTFMFVASVSGFWAVFWHDFWITFWDQGKVCCHSYLVILSLFPSSYSLPRQVSHTLPLAHYPQLFCALFFLVIKVTNTYNRKTNIDVHKTGWKVNTFSDFVCFFPQNL